MKEIMHFASFEEMLRFINQKDHAEELPEYKEDKRKKVEENVGKDD